MVTTRRLIVVLFHIPQPEGSTMRALRPTLAACSATLAAVCLTACVGGPAPAPVATVTATVPAGTATVTEKAPETDPPQETKSPAKAVTGKKKLPNVVGMNLQAGQDLLQAADFYVLNDKDATGQNRLQILDRNWVITRQSPAAGRTISTDTLITLYAKKIGE